MALRKVLYYTAQQLKGCSRARGAHPLAPRCPRGSEGQQRAGEKPGCMSCEGRERAKGCERGPLKGQLRARGGAGIGKGRVCAVWAAFAHLSESIPIEYQYTKHVNDMCAPAHHATLRCHRAALRDCSHVKQSQVRHSLTLFLSGIALTQRSQGRSQGESGQVRANKTRGFGLVRAAVRA
jgi:hypothetical protein